jgi:hypothetical protein
MTSEPASAKDPGGRSPIRSQGLDDRCILALCHCLRGHCYVFILQSGLSSLCPDSTSELHWHGKMPTIQVRSPGFVLQSKIQRPYSPKSQLSNRGQSRHLNATIPMDLDCSMQPPTPGSAVVQVSGVQLCNLHQDLTRPFSVRPE